MASGAVVGTIGEISQAAANIATYDTRQSITPIAEIVPVIDFDDSIIEVIDFYCRLEGYAGGGLTVTFDWSATSATSGDVRWCVGIRRIEDDAEDIDTEHTYDFNETTDTCASVSGERSRVSVAFTNGADMDSLANGESFILRIRRDPSNGADTMTGDAELWYWTVAIKET